MRWRARPVPILEPETNETEPEESLEEAVKKTVSEPAEPEESEVIDGQMDIMQWMESMQDTAVEDTPETDTETKAAEPEKIPDD